MFAFAGRGCTAGGGHAADIGLQKTAMPPHCAEAAYAAAVRKVANADFTPTEEAPRFGEGEPALAGSRLTNERLER